MARRVRRAVVPAAGRGTRMLPATKAVPKELLPVVDKPIVQYVIEELAAVGVEEIVVVVSEGKEAIEAHFAADHQLVAELRSQGKVREAESVDAIGKGVALRFIQQIGPYGNGTPVRCARPYVEDGPFFVAWGDDFFSATPSRAAQLLATYQEFDAPVLAAVHTTRPDDRNRYAFIGGPEVAPGVYRVETLIEKPGDRAPSNIGIVSGLLLTPDVFEPLERIGPGRGGEIWLMDAVAQLAAERPVYARVIADGKYHDCGNRLDYLLTNVELALKDPTLGPALAESLRTLLEVHRGG